MAKTNRNLQYIFTVHLIINITSFCVVESYSVKMDFKKELQDYTDVIFVDEQISLDCSVFGLENEADNISIYFNNILYYNNGNQCINRGSIMIAPYGDKQDNIVQIQINHVKLNNSGEYKCKVQSGSHEVQEDVYILNITTQSPQCVVKCDYRYTNQLNLLCYHNPSHFQHQFVFTVWSESSNGSVFNDIGNVSIVLSGTEKAVKLLTIDVLKINISTSYKCSVRNNLGSLNESCQINALASSDCSRFVPPSTSDIPITPSASATLETSFQLFESMTLMQTGTPVIPILSETDEVQTGTFPIWLSIGMSIGISFFTIIIIIFVFCVVSGHNMKRPKEENSGIDISMSFTRQGLLYYTKSGATQFTFAQCHTSSSGEKQTMKSQLTNSEGSYFEPDCIYDIEETQEDTYNLNVDHDSETVEFGNKDVVRVHSKQDQTENNKTRVSDNYDRDYQRPCYRISHAPSNATPRVLLNEDKIHNVKGEIIICNPYASVSIDEVMASEHVINGKFNNGFDGCRSDDKSIGVANEVYQPLGDDDQPHSNEVLYAVLEATD